MVNAAPVKVRYTVTVLSTGDTVLMTYQRDAYQIASLGVLLEECLPGLKQFTANVGSPLKVVVSLERAE